MPRLQSWLIFDDQATARPAILTVYANKKYAVGFQKKKQVYLSNDLYSAFYQQFRFLEVEIAEFEKVYPFLTEKVQKQDCLDYFIFAIDGVGVASKRYCQGELPSWSDLRYFQEQLLVYQKINQISDQEKIIWVKRAANSLRPDLARKILNSIELQRLQAESKRAYDILADLVQ